MMQAIRRFQWQEAAAATALLLMLVGVVFLIGWLADPMPWRILAASVFALAVSWFLCFHVVCSWHEQQARRRMIARLNRHMDWARRGARP